MTSVELLASWKKVTSPSRTRVVSIVVSRVLDRYERLDSDYYQTFRDPLGAAVEVCAACPVRIPLLAVPPAKLFHLHCCTRGHA